MKYFQDFCLRTFLFLVCPLSLFAMSQLFAEYAFANEIRLLDVEGDFSIRRKGSSQPRFAYSGMVLSVEDRIQSGANSQAVIRCDNFTFIPILSNQDNTVDSYCPDPATRGLRIGRQRDSAPGGDNPTIPFLISPRRTTVLDQQPLLSWNPIAGANSYTVQVIGPDVHWVTEVQDSNVQYPGFPAFVEGGIYDVVVESDNGFSSQLDDGAINSGFTFVYPEDRQFILEQLSIIDSKDLSPEAKALTRAYLYIDESFLSEAILELESLVLSESEVQSVYHDLGNIYRYIGLNILAKERYEQALNTADSNDNLELLASTRASLAEVNVSLGMIEQALELLEAAEFDYQTLDESERVEELRDRIKQLSSS